MLFCCFYLNEVFKIMKIPKKGLTIFIRQPVSKKKQKQLYKGSKIIRQSVKLMNINRTIVLEQQYGRTPGSLSP